jgi:putative flippase GtrA
LIARLRTLAHTHRVELIRFGKFSVVGAIGALVDFSVLNLGMRVFGLINWQANIISFSAAVFSNFMWNRHWTYPESRALAFGPQLGQFALVNVVGLAINTGILVGLDNYVFPDAWGLWGTNLAKAIAIGVVWFWNYGVNRLWTYRKIK